MFNIDVEGWLILVDVIVWVCEDKLDYLIEIFMLIGV